MEENGKGRLLCLLEQIEDGSPQGRVGSGDGDGDGRRKQEHNVKVDE